MKTSSVSIFFTPTHPTQERKAELEAERAAKVDVARQKRKDYKLKNVILNEEPTPDKYTLGKIPFPYRSPQQFEASMETPVGPDCMQPYLLNTVHKKKNKLKTEWLTPGHSFLPFFSLFYFPKYSRIFLHQPLFSNSEGNF